ncbi:3-deoxy-7-phosphoheptulonate synthase [Chloroflexota bacterium]
MIIMETGATTEQIERVVKEIEKYGLRADVSKGEFRTVIGPIGDERKLSFTHIANLPGVKEATMVEAPYKLINREYAPQYKGNTDCRLIKVGNATIGGKEPVFIAGPCAIESKKQLWKTAEGIKEAGAHILRGGIFKPRSSVHAFQGLGASDWKKAEEALKWLREAGDQFNMPVVTEVRGEAHVELVAEYVDIIQIGSRNMYNQDLLTAVGRKKKPVLFKRHFGAGIEEFLSFAEYIAAESNRNIIFCERGIVPVGKGKNYTRYLLDVAAVPVIHKETFFPVIIDPSHAAGRSDLILSMSLASIAAGADGLMIEVHHNPMEALVDASQMLTPDELKTLITTCRRVKQSISAKVQDKKSAA